MSPGRKCWSPHNQWNLRIVNNENGNVEIHPYGVNYLGCRWPWSSRPRTHLQWLTIRLQSSRFWDCVPIFWCITIPSCKARQASVTVLTFDFLTFKLWTDCVRLKDLLEMIHLYYYWTIWHCYINWKVVKTLFSTVWSIGEYFSTRQSHHRRSSTRPLKRL